MLIRLLSACTMWSFGELLAFNFKGSVKGLSLNSKPCQTRPKLVDISSIETIFYPFTVSGTKCGASCNTLNDPYAQVCVPNKVKNMKVKLFNLKLGVNKTRF